MRLRVAKKVLQRSLSWERWHAYSYHQHDRALRRVIRAVNRRRRRRRSEIEQELLAIAGELGRTPAASGAGKGEP